jgi:hypothetical protein
MLEKLYRERDMDEKQKVNEVKALFVKYGTDQLIRDEVTNLLKESEDLLMSVHGREETKQELIILAQQLTKRET